MKKTLQTLATAFTALAIISVAQSAPAHATSFNVATGNDETTTNSSCSLSEAIGNINDQAATNSDCPAGDGVNDTINIPAGTITLTTDLPTITESVTITGAGMGQTIIDGDNGQYRTPGIGGALPTDTLTVRDLTVRAFNEDGLRSVNSNLDIRRVEIDGTGAVNVENGISVVGSTGATIVFNADYVYVHSIDRTFASFGNLAGISISSSQNSTVNSTISNTTVSGLSTSNGQVEGIAAAGSLLADLSPSSMKTILNNVTISDINADEQQSVALAVFGAADGGSSTNNVEASNITVVDITGQINVGTGFKTAAFGLAAAASTPSNSADISLKLTNSLTSRTMSEGALNSCSVRDISSLFGGTGTPNLSITSGGGNVIQSDTCDTFLTDPTDKTAVAGLRGTLAGSLADNGGLIPTVALLEGSPAIDSGVTIAGLTQDARGSVRPQGLAYDSGAYESPFSKQVLDPTVPSNDGATATAPSLAATGQALRVALLAALALIVSGLFIARRTLQKQN